MHQCAMCSLMSCGNSLRAQALRLDNRWSCQTRTTLCELVLQCRKMYRSCSMPTLATGKQWCHSKCQTLLGDPLHNLHQSWRCTQQHVSECLDHTGCCIRPTHLSANCNLSLHSMLSWCWAVGKGNQWTHLMSKLLYVYDVLTHRTNCKPTNFQRSSRNPKSHGKIRSGQASHQSNLCHCHLDNSLFAELRHCRNCLNIVTTQSCAMNNH